MIENSITSGIPAASSVLIWTRIFTDEHGFCANEVCANEVRQSLSYIRVHPRESVSFSFRVAGEARPAILNCHPEERLPMAQKSIGQKYLEPGPSDCDEGSHSPEGEILRSAKSAPLRMTGCLHGPECASSFFNFTVKLAGSADRSGLDAGFSKEWQGCQVQWFGGWDAA